jgi:hypothetical protein
MLQITRVSPFSGRKVTRQLPITAEQYAAWEGGMRAQVAFPGLDADSREFIMTGIAPDEWDEAFPDQG